MKYKEIGKHDSKKKMEKKQLNKMAEQAQSNNILFDDEGPDDDEEEDNVRYTWLRRFEKSWESVYETEGGLSAKITVLAEKCKKRKFEETARKLCMIRNLVIIIDYSETMLEQDLKPTRHGCTHKLVCDFMKEFMDENPIAQLGIVISQNKVAKKISDLSGNTIKLLQDFEEYKDQTYCKGEYTLQNSLSIAFDMLKSLPSYNSREILIICGSITAVDPGNVYNTFKKMKENRIRCSVIGLSAELYIYKLLCENTFGEYSVILDDSHYKQILFDYVKPRSSNSNFTASCVRMGFCRKTNSYPSYSTCMCHLGKTKKANGSGYFCPQCKSKCCDLPTECKVCKIALATSTHLVRPVHYIAKTPKFHQLNKVYKGKYDCFACKVVIMTSTEKLQIYICEDCKNVFCTGCNEFIHDILHVCPGCIILEAA